MTKATRNPEVNDAEGKARTAVRTAILRYLSKHPRASDTLAGIYAWWLPEEGVTAGWDLFEEAVESLVEQGRIRRIRLADGTPIYGGPDPDEQD